MHEYLGGTTNKIRKSCQVSSVSIRLKTDTAFHQLVFLLPRLWSGLLAWFIGFCLLSCPFKYMLSLSKITRRWLHFGDLECGFLTFVQVHLKDLWPRIVMGFCECLPIFTTFSFQSLNPRNFVHTRPLSQRPKTLFFMLIFCL